MGDGQKLVFWPFRGGLKDVTGMYVIDFSRHFWQKVSYKWLWATVPYAQSLQMTGKWVLGNFQWILMKLEPICEIWKSTFFEKIVPVPGDFCIFSCKKDRWDMLPNRGVARIFRQECFPKYTRFWHVKTLFFGITCHLGGQSNFTGVAYACPPPLLATPLLPNNTNFELPFGYVV